MTDTEREPPDERHCPEHGDKIENGYECPTCKIMRDWGIDEYEPDIMNDGDWT